MLFSRQLYYREFSEFDQSVFYSGPERLLNVINSHDVCPILKLETELRLSVPRVQVFTSPIIFALPILLAAKLLLDTQAVKFGHKVLSHI